MHDFSPLPSGAPRQITPHSPADHFEVLTRAVFNAGLSWPVVQARWPALAKAFGEFDPTVVAQYGDDEIERLAANPRLIRSRIKIAATPVNARTFLELSEAHGGFEQWLEMLGDYDAMERALCRHFKYIGEFGAYWSLYTLRVGVPDHRQWARSRGRDLPRLGA
jgi:3-methyladenine DNA glycosylase Tag